MARRLRRTALHAAPEPGYRAGYVQGSRPAQRAAREPSPWYWSNVIRGRYARHTARIERSRGFRPVGTRCGIDGLPRVQSRRCRVVRLSATGDRGGKLPFHRIGEFGAFLACEATTAATPNPAAPDGKPLPAGAS